MKTEELLESISKSEIILDVENNLSNEAKKQTENHKEIVTNELQKIISKLYYIIKIISIVLKNEN